MPGIESETKLTKSDVLGAIYRNKFDCFAQRAFAEVYPGVPFEWNWHIGCIGEHLEACYRGELRKLIINVPPRTLKSFLTTVCFPAWLLGKEPHERIICASYSSRLSTRHSQDCRRLMRSDIYRAVFPNTEIDPNQDQKDLYYTTKNGMRYATSVLGSVTGEGANYIFLDDPIKPADAMSDVIRASTNERIEDTFMSRWNDPRTGRMIVIMQRLHEEDPTGFLLEKGGYTHLCLPAEAHSKIIIDLGKHHWEMNEGDLLFPERFNKTVLDEFRVSLGEYAYTGQFIQSPAPLGGGEFKEEWIKYYQTTDKLAYKSFNVYILIDAAGEGKDWTAMMVIGLGPDNNYYWLDGVRDHLNPTQRVNKTFDLHRKWNAICDKPPVVGYEAYGMMTDTHYIDQKQKQENYRFNLVELKGNKKDRKNQDIRRLVPDMQRGRWYFPNTMPYTAAIEERPLQFDLVQEVVKGEMRSFPVAKFDDMLDAMSRIYDEELGATFPKLKKEPSWQKYVGKIEEPNDWMTM